MSSKRHTAEQIINKLRQAEVEIANGATVAQVCKKIGVTEQTYCRWCAEYGGMRVDQAKRLKEWSRRPPGSSGWWPTRRWTSRS